MLVASPRSVTPTAATVAVAASAVRGVGLPRAKHGERRAVVKDGAGVAAEGKHFKQQAVRHCPSQPLQVLRRSLSRGRSSQLGRE